MSGSLWMSKSDWARSWKAWFRGALFGFPIGAMPAGGAELPSTADTATTDNTIKLKYSAGPKANAASTTQGATKVKANVPTVPATKLPMAAVAKA